MHEEGRRISPQRTQRARRRGDKGTPGKRREEKKRGINTEDTPTKSGQALFGAQKGGGMTDKCEMREEWGEV